MKKLFSIFCCLLLSASMVTWAQESPIRDANIGDVSELIINENEEIAVEEALAPTNGPRKAPTATQYAIMKNSTVQFANVQKTSTTNQYNVFIKTISNYSSSTVTGFVIKGANFGSETAIGGSHSFTSSYSNCTSSNNWFVQNFKSASSATYVDNPYGTITFTFSSMGSDGYPIYRVQISNCYGYTSNSGSCVNWKNAGAVFAYDDYVSIRPYASDGSTRIDFTDYYTITVESSNSSMGTVTGSGTYAASSNQTLTATVTDSEAYEFVGWTKNGGSSYVSTSASYNVTISGNDTYQAVFAAKSATQYTITANSDNTTYGTVSGGGDYYEGTQATLTATPTSLAYGFTKWQKNGVDFSGNTTNPLVVEVTEAATYTAFFEEYPPATITVISNYGTVTGAGSYTRGTEVTLTVTPNSGYRFAQWSDENTDNPRVITVTGDATYNAQYYDLSQPLLASFSWETDNISIETYGDGNSLCNSFYSPAGKQFHLLYAKATDRDTKNYLNLSIQSSQTYMWGETSFFKPGSYPVESSGLTTGSCNSGTYWYWTLDNTDVCVAYGYDDYDLGLNPLGSYLCDKSGDAEDTSDQSNYISVGEGITTVIEVGENGDPYIRLVRNSDGQCLVSVGAPLVTYTVTINTPENGSLTVTDEDETAIASGDEVAEGTVLTVTATPATGYHFSAWTNDGAASVTVNADKTIGATFAVNTHNVSWVTDGNELTGTYTSGTTAYGTTIVTPNTPTKTGYTFNAWSPAVAATMPDNDVTYTATWTATTYNLTYEGLEGATNTNPDTYTIESETITLADPNARDGYAFIGWTCGGETITEIAAGSTGDKTITANWNAKLSAIELEENRENSFYNTFKTTYNGATGLVVTYPRQFTASRWSTMCLPFSLDLATMIANKMYGCVYEFKYATGNANVGSGVNLYFSNAKSIEAGKCYIVNANAELAAKTSFVFSGVTIDLSKDNGAALDSEDAYDDLPGYKSQGTIELVGTLRNGTLQGSATGNTYMGLKSNKIYYPNTDTGSTIWAYRGIFRSTSALNVEKMRIVVDGEDKGEIRIDNGELIIDNGSPVRKFIRNGNLYIEREGVIYDAQGKRVE